METPTKTKSGDATGVSRSGRVRKKSSKLTDFESPDEIDTRFKRKTDRPQKPTPHTAATVKEPRAVVAPMAAEDVYEDSDTYMEEDMIDIKEEPLEVEEWGGEEDEEEGEEEEGPEGEFQDPLHVDDDSTELPRETSSYTQAHSLYFSEKQGKKNMVLKDGQVVRRKKAQRKDKGKSRFTAYMLWAREIRPGIIQANPNMDFSAVNKRLGELWALVPTTQKYIADKAVEIEGENATHSQVPVVKHRCKTLLKSCNILDITAKKLDKLVDKVDNGNEAFGKYVACRLNSMDQCTAVITRKILNDVLFEVEMRNLTNSSRILTAPPQELDTIPLPLPSDSSFDSNNIGNNCDSDMTQRFANFQHSH